jgi:NTE family protein
MDYKNLVFAGGGVKGIAYLGSLEILDNKDILKNIKRVAGTSAGSITACIVSMYDNYKDIKAVADKIDYSKVPADEEHYETKKTSKGFITELEHHVMENQSVDNIYRLLKEYGWYSSSYVYKFLRESIEDRFKQNKKEYTFRDFKNNNMKDLYVIGTDMVNRCTRVFSYEDTPDIEVAKAVRISMSIPLYFESEISDYKNLKNIVFSDGGVMRNYPINIFDKEAYEINSKLDATGRNEETLGFNLYSQKESKEITNIIEYIENLFDALLSVQTDMLMNNEEDMKRTVNINTFNIKSTDFDIKVNDQKYNKLFNSGKETTQKYLSNVHVLN